MLCYRKKSNLISSKDQPITSDCEFIRVECCAKYDNYKSILMNQVDGKSYSQVLVHDAAIKNLTYEDKDAKG